MRRFPVKSVIIAAALVATAFLFLERVNIPEKSEPRDDSPGHFTAPPEPAPSLPLPAEQEKYRQVAIIIDDIGYDLQALRKLARLPAPLAFAVIPYTPHAAEAAEFLHKGKREVLLHLPMEPRSYPNQSPGAGALMTNMDEGQIVRQIRADLEAVPHVSGVNNHMGSRFMEDAPRLKVLMRELKKRNLYFVDSRTTPRSLGREAASEAGVRFAERNSFIDHEHGYKAAIRTLRKVSMQIKETEKPLLLIGHPHAETIRAIEDILPVWQKEGVRIVDIRTCLRNGQ